MKDKPFKFSIGERVFILGRPGVCVITGRGHMDFISGGKMNYYSLEGGQVGLHPESALITYAEAHSLANN